MDRDRHPAHAAPQIHEVPRPSRVESADECLEVVRRRVPVRDHLRQGRSALEEPAALGRVRKQSIAHIEVGLHDPI